MPKEKLVVVSLGSPYVLNEYFERVDTCINACSNDAVTQEALVRALLGEIPFQGTSPVAESGSDLEKRYGPSCPIAK